MIDLTASVRRAVLRPRAVLALTLALMLALALASPSLLFAGTYETTWRASVATDGGEPIDYPSEYPAISNDGRYVVFQCEAANLVANDTNGATDIFLYDRQTGEVTLASVRQNGTHGSEGSEYPDISADGRFYAFDSASLFATSGSTDDDQIWVVERETGTVELASRTSAGAPGNGQSYRPTLSADGRYVAYSGNASNLVSDDTNGYEDVFVYDCQTNTTVRASVASDGDQALDNWSSAPSISADGRHVVFDSRSSQLAPDPSSNTDIFAHDLDTGATVKVSLAYNGAHANDWCQGASVSGDGRYAVFSSRASNLIASDTNGNTDVFLRDLQLNTTTRVSVSNSGTQLSRGAYYSKISDDGRFVVFATDSPDVVPGVTDMEDNLYVRDLVKGTTTLVSPAYGGALNDGAISDPALGVSGNSIYVTFAADSTNLVSQAQTGYYYQIYVHEMTNLPGDEGPNAVAGTTRFSTGVEISKASFASGSDTVVIATGRNWPDALGGAALAGAWDAPILLVDTASVPSVVKTEIDRLGATHAIILGGTTVVTDAVKTALLAIGDIDTVDRIGGSNRYATAQLVADAAIEKAGPDWNGTAFVATGDNFPDALAGSPLAYAKKWPIYLVKPNSVLPTGVMRDDGVTDVLILGGETVVSDFAEEAFEANFGTSHVDRLAGANRYATAVEVGTYGVDEAGLHWDGMAFATGENFPDALAGGSITGRHDSVMLLVETDALPGYVKNAATAHADRITTWSYLGGTAAIQTPVRTQIDTILK